MVVGTLQPDGLHRAILLPAVSQSLDDADKYRK